MIAAEVADIKKERVHRFRRHNTDVRGTLFIEFPKAEGGSVTTRRKAHSLTLTAQLQ
jgi:hypothetical protein